MQKNGIGDSDTSIELSEEKTEVSRDFFPGDITEIYDDVFEEDDLRDK